LNELGLLLNGGKAVKSTSSRLAHAVGARLWVAVLVLIAMLGVQPAASAAPALAGPAALHGPRPLVPTCGDSSCDWPEFHQDPGLTGVAPNSTVSSTDAAQLGVAWATNLYGAALDSPAVAYDATLNETLAYIGTESGNMIAINVANGQIVWATWVGSPIRTSPAVSNGAVYFGTFDSPRVYELNATTGAVICSIAAPQPIEGTPVVADPPGGVPTVYVGNNDSIAASGPVLAIATSNCSLEWAFAGYNMLAGTWTAAAYTLSATGVPLLVFGTADPDSTVYAINAVTGAKVWEYTVDNPPPGVYDIGAGTTISPPGANGFADGVVYVPTKYGYMYALDLTTGALVWRVNFNQLAGITGEGGRSTASLDGNNLVFGYAQGVFDLDAVTGGLIWKYVSPNKTEALSSPAISGPTGQEVVSVGELGGGVDVVSLATGAQLYRYQTSGYITASPAVSGGNLMIASSDGFLYDFAAGGGNEANLPTTAITSPADGSTLPNPNGNLVISGTAADAIGVAGVSIAIQENGPAGEWWDGATNSWISGPMANPATLASPGTTSSTWTYSFPPVPTGTPYTITATTMSSGGQSDIKSAHVGVSVLASTKGAHVKANPIFVAPGATLTVTGSGFKAGETVSLSLVGKILGSATATPKGNISTKLRLPAGALFGPTSITATGQTSGRSASAGLTIANAWTQAGYSATHGSFEPNDPSLYNLVHPGSGIFVDLAWEYQTSSVVDTSPAVVDGVAYIGDKSGALTAIDIRNGAPVWTWDLPSGVSIAGSPAVDARAGLVIVGADDGTIDAISTATGKLVWWTSVGGDVSAPVLAGGVVYVTSSNGAVKALDEETGAPTWSTTLASPSAAEPTVDAAAKELFVGEADGQLQELNADTGAAGWTFAASGAVTSSPAISGGVLYFGSAGAEVYAVSESTGTQLWAFKTSGTVNDTPALTNQITPAHVLELIVGDANGHLYFLVASNATVNYKITLKGAVTGVAAMKGVAVAELSGGLITAARSYSDLDTWQYQTAADLTTSPVLVDGTIYVGAGDGHLYAFTSYGQPPA
jgi:outer membrane protein assembly factor BamB